MLYQAESARPCWRAVAQFDDRGDRVVYVGHSSAQVWNGFALTFFKVIAPDECGHLRALSLERWHGADGAGKWVHQSALVTPTGAKLAA